MTTPEALPLPAQGAEDRRARRREVAWSALAAASLVAALVHPVASQFSRYDWLCDLVSHFQVAALTITLIATGIMARRHRRLVIPLVILAGFQTAPLLEYGGANPVPADPDRPERLRLLMANVLHDNERYGDLAALIRKEKPDIVGLVEYGPEWMEALAEVRAEYPYRLEHPQRSSGLALWFRERPTLIEGPIWLTWPGNSVIRAQFDFAGKERTLWLVHPTSPLYRRGRPGHPELTTLAKDVASVAGSRIVMGDFNTTEGSAHFHDFLAATALRDSRLGFGRQPSWPTDLPYRIPIDHAMVDKDLTVVERRLGPDIGSDHFPLLFELAPAAKKLSAQRSQPSRDSF